MKEHITHRSPIRLLCLLAVLAGCCLNPGDLFKAKHKTTQTVSAPVAGVTELQVETNVGAIIITGSDVTDCNVTAEITVKAGSIEKARELAEQVKIKTESSADRLSVRAVKPAELKDNQLTVDFRITVPKRLSLNCTSHVGAVTVSGMTGNTKVSANVGSIYCNDAAADIDLQTNVGSVKVSYLDAAPVAFNAKIATNVGSINLTLPAKVSAQLGASTNIGSIKTGKPITIVGKLDKSIEGTIGDGQGRISLTTNVGSIEIE